MNNFVDLSNCPTASHWNAIGRKHHHGIVIPLFSIHSKRSYGIGEYTDLPQLIDWCASIGFDVIQLLPLNDTGNGNSPYSSLSAFALNPIYIGLDALPFVNEDPFLMKELKALPRFSQSPLVEYSQVRENKEKFLTHYFRIFGQRIMETDAFKQFLHDASFWLKGYAVYRVLKKRHHHQSWEVWIEKESAPSPEFIDMIALQEAEQFQWFCFLQFLCDQQLKDAKAYAKERGVFLMGDIPILIDRDSADVWLHHSLFNLSFSAGAPPDFYSEYGQNWGFPIYNWDEVARQEYHWWVERLRWAERYYQIYRIDHIVGFFRIWAIPLGLTGKDGQFQPQDEKTWLDHGRKILLMMINSCGMLPIGEDLGTVPPEARQCLTELGICGTRVMRWERYWNEGGNFIEPKDYPLCSMTTVSTHDSEGTQQWWRDLKEDAELFAKYKGWRYEIPLSREHLKEILADSHHTSSLFHINPLQEYLGLIPGLSWPDPENERINIPGIMNDRNWGYRLRPSLEELAEQETLMQWMKKQTC